ncbi:MAG: ParB/RepB/Spo0J family partition protein [Clostridia bacterium]|nr:ParB/RepB/Spo0J family partition protein [Clostridia bacterium]
MAQKKGGLGKGLELLFAENALEDSAKTVSLPINELQPNREQPRRQFDDAALAELSASIAQHGVLQPILVRPMTGGTYQIVAGERRWRASRMAGLTEVPVVVREMADREAAELALIENLQREDLNPMEEALGYQTLMQSYELTQEETAKIVNKSREAVANTLRLLRLPQPVAEMVAAGTLSAGHARAVLSFAPELQVEVAEQAVKTGASVRELERQAKAVRTSGTKPITTAPPRRDSFYDEVELALSEQLGRRVRVVVGNMGGTLSLEFYGQDDLRELANKLAPAE